MSDVFTVGSGLKPIEVIINGTSQGSVDVEPGTTLLNFVNEQATNAGIRTFSVYVDGRKVDTNEAQTDITRYSRVEITAKDSRG